MLCVLELLRPANSLRVYVRLEALDLCFAMKFETATMGATSDRSVATTCCLRLADGVMIGDLVLELGATAFCFLWLLLSKTGSNFFLFLVY